MSAFVRIQMQKSSFHRITWFRKRGKSLSNYIQTFSKPSIDLDFFMLKTIRIKEAIEIVIKSKLKFISVIN